MSSAELPTGTLTFLFTDIEGSTVLLKDLRSGYVAVLADHQRIIRRLAARAGQVEGVNPPAARAFWQEAEQKLLLAAPLVATDNPQAFDFVAKRVGDYQYHPQWGALVDQLWVR